jgi:hypothetical protein
MNGPIYFPEWKEQLSGVGLGAEDQEAYRREILTFLKHCKAGRTAATVEVARRFLVERERASRGPAREALRWFFRAGARAMRARQGAK